MTLKVIPASFGEGGLSGPDVRDALRELQGFNVSVVTGATIGTKMNLAALRPEDTVIAALQTDTFADDTANLTVLDTHASGTLTVTGAPNDGQTFLVNDVTYRCKTVPAQANDVKISATVGVMAANIAAAINNYENRLSVTGGNGARNAPAVIASANAGVVTIKSVADGVGNAPSVSSTGGTITVGNNNTAIVTATAASAIATDTLTVNGVVFTVTATPASLTDILLEGTDILQANEIAKVINEYEDVHGTLDVRASTTGLSGVVTLVPRTAKKGNIITLTEALTNVAASGAGTLAGGTATGGFTSTTDHATKTLLVFWYNKNP
jgi:hypothetical protein